MVFDWKKGIKQSELNIVVDTLKNDGLVILPTETVYGLGANACSNIACKKIFEAKGRAQDNPLIVHVSDINMIGRVVQDLSEIEEKLVKAFMPGPFTLILKKSKVISDVASCNMILSELECHLIKSLMKLLVNVDFRLLHLVQIFQEDQVVLM